jgi:hypothetical protein
VAAVTWQRAYGSGAVADDGAPITISAESGAALQRQLNELAARGGGRLRLDKPVVITCPYREDVVAGETSRHALLVPEGVQLDLNGSSLELDLKHSCYGVRLSSRSAIRNGTIKVVRSEGVDEESQAIWHSAISIGAAYGDGGTVAKPGQFALVSDWTIEDMNLDQPFGHSVIQVMSEAHHGVIKKIRIADSQKARLGIGFDWGSVGPISTPDELVPSMRQLWDKNEIYSTHPHDVLMEDIEIGRLDRKIDGNDAGIRFSACHRMTVKNLRIKSAAAAVAIFGGDFGYEFAPPEQRAAAHTGYLIEDVSIEKASLYGLVFNGLADNIYRSSLKYGYKAIDDPAHPGLNKMIVRNAVLRGLDKPNSYGIYITSATEPRFENVDIEGFDQGVRVKDWVRSLRFERGRIAKVRKDVAQLGGTEAPVDIVFDKFADH